MTSSLSHPTTPKRCEALKMIKLAVFVLFNILGVGCLVAAILFGSSPPETTFIVLVGGAGVASLGIGSLLAFMEIKGRHREKPLCARPLEPQVNDYVRTPQRIMR